MSTVGSLSPARRRTGFLLLIFLTLLCPRLSSGESNAPKKTALPPPADRLIQFHLDIEPILTQHCIKCHARGKNEGGFQIDTRDLILKGSDTGPVVVTGRSEESYLIDLVSGQVPGTVMPPEGERLSEEEIGLLRAWIDQGVPWQEGVSVGQFAEAPVTLRRVILPEARFTESDHPIDRILEPYFLKQAFSPPQPVSDAVFARRVYFDVIGLPPSPEELKAFLEDSDPEKRPKLVDRLLSDHVGYAENWITFWNDLLRNDFTGTGYIDGGRKQITHWLFEALESNMPYDRFVRELVNPSGEDSLGFIKGIVWRGVVNSSQTPEMQAAQNIGQVFLGLNLKCASCHDSFISNWKLEDSYGLASVFSEGPLEIHRCDTATGQDAQIKFLFHELGAIDPRKPHQERQERLADILTTPQNGRLARTIANRLWTECLGRGVIEPNDEMDREPWNADLLDWLALDLVEHGYDLKRSLRTILTSGAYQLPSVAWDGDKKSSFEFKGPVHRRLTAEKFRDGLCSITNHWPGAPGTDLKAANEVNGATRLRSWMLKRDALTVAMGRPNRDQIVSQRPTFATTLEALELTNGVLLSSLLREGADKLLANAASPQDIVERVYLHGLSREPTAEEQELVLEMIGNPPEAKGVEDFLWTIAMLPEFQVIR